MTTRKSNEERLEELDLKMKQLMAQKQALVKREKEQEKKKLNAEWREYNSTPERSIRTRRLIQNGALSEKYFNCSNISPTEYEELLKKLVSLDPVKILISKEQ